MSATKAPKLTVKQLQRIIADQNDMLVTLRNELEAERKNIRLPAVMTVGMFNTIVDFLNQTKPEPMFPKEVPAKLVPMGEGGEA